MVNDKESEVITCAQCGLLMKIKAFNLSTKEGIKYFCCSGCLNIYRILNDWIQHKEQ